MAKKKQDKRAPETSGISKPEGFTHGMVSDLDPHFQLKGSYSDARNIRLTNSEGDTFTVENIEGNSLFVDLATYPISINAPANNTNYPTFYDRGPNAPYPQAPTNESYSVSNYHLADRCSIVGHYSYADQLLLIIVGRFEYEQDGGVSAPAYNPKDRTIFLLVDFNEDFLVTKVTDLRVCYNLGWNYPDLGMKKDIPVRIEAMVENHCISRIYWTDNVNPLRTLNIKQENLEALTIESLELTPIMTPCQPVLDRTVHGSLPVGVYQYTYKYISENGGETTFAPLSNLYHVSDQSFTSSMTYGGGPRGNLGTQGFVIKIHDCDQDFEFIECYALFYDSLNQPPRVALVDRVSINGSLASFMHTNWSGEIERGLEEILIESNTWDVCKDIAIKDNILFAANLKQKKNWISEKEWNVKVMRWRIREGSDSVFLDAMLTTNDPEVKHYQGTPGNATEISNGTQDYAGHYCGHGKLLGIDTYLTSSNPEFEYNGMHGHPQWFTQNWQRDHDGTDLTGRVKNKYEYRYLQDRMTLGGESFEYIGNGLGGCRVTFGLQERVADQTQNTSSSPYISATADQEELRTNYQDFDDSTGYTATTQKNTVFKTSMSLGGSKDPHAAGNKRGYQRGEVYRFGVQTFDLTGAPGNVLWIGDIETPQQHDVLRQLRTTNNYYTPYRKTTVASAPGGLTNLVDGDLLCSSEYAQDHRLSYVYGHVVPLVDVEWFSARWPESQKNLKAYVKPSGQQQELLPNDGNNSGWTPGGRRKALTWSIKRDNAASAWKYFFGVSGTQHYDNTHYLLDLFVNFEFIIPKEVCEKMSGFRVVRAIRTEEDRRIVQQGLLNQTVQYGDATKELKDGYDATQFSNADNNGFDDDPVFTNSYNPQHGNAATTPTQAEQPEYNAYLNGYLGLAENTYYAFYGSSSGGQATTGGNTAGKVFFWPEWEDRKAWISGEDRQTHSVPNHRNDGAAYAAGYMAEHKRMSAYFGGFDKLTRKHATDGYDHSDGNTNNYARTEVSGSIFTLDSPDSAFGIRPYNFREGDVLRIDSVLKLTDSDRYGTGWVPNGYYGHNLNTNVSTNFGNSIRWEPDSTNKTAEEGLRFASRKVINEDYGVLIAKYYCWDTYYGIGMEIGGGKFAGTIWTGNDVGHRPKSQGWYLPIASAKELSDGEIVPSGFFKKSRRVNEGRVHGFSNNTLGYVKTQRSGDGRYNYKVWSGIHEHLTKVVGDADSDNGGPVSGWTTAKQKKDYTYDTVSTMQMGLRSILIELNTKTSEVRQNDNSGYSSWFDIYHATGSANHHKMRHSEWFAPHDLSSIYEYGSWNGGSDSNGYDGVYWYKAHWMSVLTRYIHSSYAGTSRGNCDDRGKGHHPHQFLCSIVRNVTPYGGWTKGSIANTRYIPCGNFHEVPTNDATFQAHLSQVFGGDTFVNLYSHQKTSAPYMKKSMIRFKVFPVESYVNTDMRSGLNLNNGDTVVGKDMNVAPFSNDWLYNSVYSQENTIKSALMIDESESCDNLDLPYEIAYSNTKILGQRSDAFRVFPINQFHDMEGTYGEINRIINFKNEIYVFQDSAFSKLLVNPLSMLSDDSGTSLFTGTGETVENHIYISTKYGTRHRFSVAASEKALYFVDVNFGRLFRYDTEKLVSLGDALGQRNYLRYITKHWEIMSKRICTSNSGAGAPFGTAGTAHPANTDVWHGSYTTDINSKEKVDRNYLADNPLKFIGINAIFDYNNKELMITFHNSAMGTERRRFARISDLHSMGSTQDGQPISHSETLVYNEGINAFTSKYTVAPPQWLSGSQGSFILCPENQLSAYELTNWNYKYAPYSQTGSADSADYIDFRCNPLRLWIWDKHDEGKRTHFFGEKIGRVHHQTEPSWTDPTGYPAMYVKKKDYDSKDYAHESYIVKVINSEASDSKIFDNAEIVMTPSSVPFSDIKYITDTSINNVSAHAAVHNKTITIDEEEQVVINRRWDFNDSSEGWYFYDGSVVVPEANIVNTGSSTLTLDYQGDGRFRSPRNKYAFNQGGGDQLRPDDRGFVGKYNNILRMRVKRTDDSGAWEGVAYWKGSSITRNLVGTPVTWNESGGRKSVISEPAGIDDDFVIIEWDMSVAPDSYASWDDSRIEQVRIDLDSSTGTYEVDWVELIGIDADKYSDGVLKAPLRTAKSKGRSRGTWSKIKYSANTTEKFNIFAILAKYRKLF